MFSQKLLHWQLTTFMQCWPNIWCGKSINCNPENYPWWAENHLELNNSTDIQVILNGVSSTPVTHHRLVGGTNLFFRLYLVVNSHKCKKKKESYIWKLKCVGIPLWEQVHVSTHWSQLRSDSCNKRWHILSGLSALSFTTAYNLGSAHDSLWPLLTCVSFWCYNFVKLVVLISRLTTENSVVVKMEEDEQ